MADIRPWYRYNYRLRLQSYSENFLSEKLLAHFGSVARLKAAEPEAVVKLIGKVAAGKVAGYFEQNQDT